MNNEECMGYALMAATQIELTDEQKKKLIKELHYCFDRYSEVEAFRYYAEGLWHGKN